jgi:hypothetical protein
MLSKSVTIEFSCVAARSLDPTCRTARFPFEWLHSDLHFPPPRLTYGVRGLKQAFTGVRVALCAAVANRRPLPITEVFISGTLEGGLSFEPFRCPQLARLDPAHSVSFPIASFVPDAPGPLTIDAILEYKFDNAKQRLRAREVCVFEPPLAVVARVHGGPLLMYEVRVENSRLGCEILNVRGEVGEAQFAIAQSLGLGEEAAGFAVVPAPMRRMTVLWDMPGCVGCFQIVELPVKTEDRSAPIAIALTMPQPIIRCLEPFTVKIILENRAGMEISGELTIRSGPIALSGLNAIQFNEIPPGESETLEGSFCALEEGRLVFPAFQVAIKEGRRFEVDAANGVFVIGSAV